MAYHDELTGLPGRRALNEALLRVGSRYAVAMVDVDHFKHFNDAYGHEVGDQVLRMVAAQLDRGGRQSAVPRQGFRSKPSDAMIRGTAVTVVERRNAWISG